MSDHPTHSVPSDQSEDSVKSHPADTTKHFPTLPHRHGTHAEPRQLEESAQAAIGQIKPPHQLEIEDVDLTNIPSSPRTGRTVLASLATVVVVIGLAAVWFHFNQNVYSLDNSEQTAVNVTPTQTNPATLGAETNKTKTLSLTANLPTLSQGHYQAWINHSDQDMSLGIFKPAENGSLQNSDGSAFAPSTTYAKNDTVFVTIESGDVAAVTPSKTVILTGKINDQGLAKLGFKAIDLSSAGGSFVLATPTDTAADPKSGVWFAKADGDNLGAPSLNLPVAPEGWKYEGQIVYKGVAVEIGRFSQADKADEFNKFTPNSDKSPAFPGEDFLQKAPGQLDLDFPTSVATGEWQVVVSIEPDQGGEDPTGSDPFYLQPLKATIAQDAEAHKDITLTLDVSTFPTATASFK